MSRAFRAAGLALLLARPGAAARAVEVSVEMSAPDRGTVRIRVVPPLASSAGFHRLIRDGQTGWRRAPVRFERDPDGGLRFESEVLAAADGWLRVAIPLPDAPPPAGADLSFAAEIHPPPGYRVVDSFPTRLELPAPPSLLRFRVIPEAAAGVGLAALVDGGVALLLLGLAVFGAARLLRGGDPG